MNPMHGRDGGRAHRRSHHPRHPGRPGPVEGPHHRRGGRGRAPRGDVRAAILLLLAEEPMHGYQLMQAVAERTGAQFYDAPSASELGKVYDDIGSKVGYREERKDATHWPLGVGVAFLVIAAGLSLAWQQKLP